MLEEIAFSALAANKDKYIEAYADFATHRNAKKIIKKLEQLNLNFYPVGLNAPIEVAPGQKHFVPIPDGFMDNMEGAADRPARHASRGVAANVE